MHTQLSLSNIYRRGRNLAALGLPASQDKDTPIKKQAQVLALEKLDTLIKADSAFTEHSISENNVGHYLRVCVGLEKHGDTDLIEPEFMSLVSELSKNQNNSWLWQQNITHSSTLLAVALYISFNQGTAFDADGILSISGFNQFVADKLGIAKGVVEESFNKRYLEKVSKGKQATQADAKEMTVKFLSDLSFSVAKAGLVKVGVVEEGEGAVVQLQNSNAKEKGLNLLPNEMLSLIFETATIPSSFKLSLCCKALRFIWSGIWSNPSYLNRTYLRPFAFNHFTFNGFVRGGETRKYPNSPYNIGLMLFRKLVLNNDFKAGNPLAVQALLSKSPSEITLNNFATAGIFTDEQVDDLKRNGLADITKKLLFSHAAILALCEGKVSFDECLSLAKLIRIVIKGSASPSSRVDPELAALILDHAIKTHNEGAIKAFLNLSDAKVRDYFLSRVKFVHGGESFNLLEHAVVIASGSIYLAGGAEQQKSVNVVKTIANILKEKADTPEKKAAVLNNIENKRPLRTLIAIATHYGNNPALVEWLLENGAGDSLYVVSQSSLYDDGDSAFLLAKRGECSAEVAQLILEYGKTHRADFLQKLKEKPRLERKPIDLFAAGLLTMDQLKALENDPQKKKFLNPVFGILMSTAAISALESGIVTVTDIFDLPNYNIETYSLERERRPGQSSASFRFAMSCLGRAIEAHDVKSFQILSALVGEEGLEKSFQETHHFDGYITLFEYALSIASKAASYETRELSTDIVKYFYDRYPDKVKEALTVKNFVEAVAQDANSILIRFLLDHGASTLLYEKTSIMLKDSPGRLQQMSVYSLAKHKKCSNEMQRTIQYYERNY